MPTSAMPSCEGARLWGSDFREAKFCDADLSSANLMCAQLVHTDFTGANLTGCKVFGTAVWEAKLTDATQDLLIISSPREIDEGKIFEVESLQEAQFMQLLHHDKFRPVLDAITKRSVLLLGRFRGGGIELLRAVATRLRELGYLPIVFDFPRQEDRNYTETVKILAGLSRFVVVDLSGPSVPQELYATVPHLKIPFVPIMEKGRHSYAMFQDILEYPWVIEPILDFPNQEYLVNMIENKIIAPAEKKIKERHALLNRLIGEETQ